MKKFSTTITALVTPFKNNKIDWSSLEKLVNHQLKNGVGGFVINGTTAESPTLEWAEVSELFQKVKAMVPSAFPLIMGTGSNSTQATIEMSRRAEALGVDAVLVVVPYYNKPPQRGMIRHFTAVAEAVKIPLILYNVPSRTITALTVESIAELAKHPRIIGIKEASGNIEFAKDIIRACPKDFLMLSGDDGSYAEFLQVGGHGVISVASHVIPNIFRDLLQKKDDPSLFNKYLPLIQLLFVEANPIPVKKALQLMGLIESAELRLPLCEMDAVLSQDLARELKKMELL